MTPSEAILSEACRSRTVTDSQGRQLVVQPLTALHTLRLLKAAGPELSLNDAWLSMASLAFAVTAIDDMPVPPPATEAQIEAIIARLGDAGVTAVADAIGEATPTVAEPILGNSLGTPC